MRISSARLLPLGSIDSSAAVGFETSNLFCNAFQSMAIVVNRIDRRIPARSGCMVGNPDRTLRFRVLSGRPVTQPKFKFAGVNHQVGRWIARRCRLIYLLHFGWGFLNTISSGSQSERRFASAWAASAWGLSDDLAKATDTSTFPFRQ